MSGKRGAVAPVWRAALLCAVAVACARPEDGTSRDSAAATQAGAADTASGWRVSARGVGPVRVGMSAADAAAALGDGFSVADTVGECGYVHPREAPAGLSFMVVKGSIARTDIDSATVPTTEGARVGDSEARVQQLYAGRVAVSPHKYTDGHYLTVTPAAAADSAFRIIFETDGRRVINYRAGRLPEVEWIEGCS